MTDRALRRAFGYPYRAPSGSWLFRDGGHAPLANPFDRSGLNPVLAFGSNRAPAQLARKYAGWPSPNDIPVTEVAVAGADVVYSAHFTAYGSLPAKLVACPGVSLRLHVVWLTDRQLDRMHETEGRTSYAFEPYPLGPVDCSVWGALERVHWYRGLRPAFAPDGAPLALKAVPAAGRRYAAASQIRALARARAMIDPEEPLAGFVRRLITDAGARARATAALMPSCAQG